LVTSIEATLRLETQHNKQPLDHFNQHAKLLLLL
jgi:hypothetical protein